jgi:hypothetical protein
MKNYLLKSIYVLIIAASILSCSSDDSHECSTGFTGSNCDIKITPTKIKINRIDIKDFPQNNGSSTWDNGEDTSGNNPDLLFVIKEGNNPIYLLPLDQIGVDATNILDYMQMIIPGLEIINPNAAYGIELYDYDGTLASSDLMVNHFFALYDPTTHTFPDHITISNSAQHFEADIYMTYEW